jgi:hypothetical protein
MKTLEKLKTNGFPQLGNVGLMTCFGGKAEGSNRTDTFSECDNITGCTTTTTVNTIDNADGSKCQYFTTRVNC